jgi:hypothetical protein
MKNISAVDCIPFFPRPSSFPQSTYFHVRSVADYHNANGDGFFLLGIGQSMPFHLAMVQMAYLIQFTEQMREALARDLNID